MTTTKTTAHWVYAGRRINGKNRISYCWAPALTAEDGSYSLGDLLWFSKAKCAGSVIGGLHEVTIQETDTGFTLYHSGDNGPRYIGPHDSGDNGPRYIGPHDKEPELMARWQVQDRTAATQKRALGKAKKDAEDMGLRAMLAPVRAAYRRTSTASRAALLAAVIYEVTR